MSRQTTGCDWPGDSTSILTAWNIPQADGVAFPRSDACRRPVLDPA